MQNHISTWILLCIDRTFFFSSYLLKFTLEIFENYYVRGEDLKRCFPLRCFPLILGRAARGKAPGAALRNHLRVTFAESHPGGVPQAEGLNKLSPPCRLYPPAERPLGRPCSRAGGCGQPGFKGCTGCGVPGMRGLREFRRGCGAAGIPGAVWAAGVPGIRESRRGPSGPAAGGARAPSAAPPRQRPRPCPQRRVRSCGSVEGPGQRDPGHGWEGTARACQERGPSGQSGVGKQRRSGATR